MPKSFIRLAPYWTRGRGINRPDVNKGQTHDPVCLADVGPSNLAFLAFLHQSEHYWFTLAKCAPGRVRVVGKTGRIRVGGQIRLGLIYIFVTLMGTNIGRARYWSSRVGY